jgi:hypothetical protein
LMTADYLLTARDLPGWPGRFDPIDFRQVLSKAINELTHGLYGNDRICRELGILLQIAEKHNLAEFLRTRVASSRRRIERRHYEGSGINARAFLLDGESYNIHNIGEAAIAAEILYRAYLDLRPGSLCATISKSLSYRLRALRKGDLFPPEAQWCIPEDKK